MFLWDTGTDLPLSLAGAGLEPQLRYCGSKMVAYWQCHVASQLRMNVALSSAAIPHEFMVKWA